jgi:uncharacterized membrane protein
MFVPESHGGPSALAWTIFALQLLLLAGLAYLVVRSVAGSWRPAAATATTVAPAPQANEAVEIVRMRYARGEVSRDEYVQAVRDLGGTADEAPTLAT